MKEMVGFSLSAERQEQPRISDDAAQEVETPDELPLSWQGKLIMYPE